MPPWPCWRRSWLGLAAASSIVTDYGFTLARAGNDLVVRRGLLERRAAALARLQVVRIEESLLRRALGLASIRIQSAGRTGGGDRTASRLAVPVLPRVQVNRVLEELLPGRPRSRGCCCHRRRPAGGR